MTHKQDWPGQKIWSNPRELKYVMQEGGGKGERRAMLMSSSDLRRLTAERHRVRQLGSAWAQASNESIPSKDTYNPQAPTKDTDSLDEFTAHTIESIMQRKAVIPVYPSIVVGESDWCAFRPTCCKQTKPDFQDFHYKCKCVTCTTASCPSKMSPKTPSTERASPFKDNIIRFCDQCTMTAKLTDACCGKAVTYIPCDTESQPCPSAGIHKVCTRGSFAKLPPPPILKRKGECCYDSFPNHHNQHDMQQEPLRNTEDYSHYCCKPKPEYESFSRPDYKHMRPPEYEEPTPFVEVVESNRRILYNEGISDDIISCPGSAIRKRRSRPSCAIRNRRKSRLSVNVDNYIPYSHIGTSKYHHDCKKSPICEPRDKTDFCSSRELFEPSDCRDVRDCRNAHAHSHPRKTWYTKHPSCRQPCAYYPRKVLPSEKNVDRFMKWDRTCSRQF